MSNLLLKPGTRLRTGGVSYEVTDNASVPAGVVEVVPQTTRLLKVVCTACGYTARVTQRWITKSGTPICPCGHGPMDVAAAKERESKPAAAPKPPKAPKVQKSKPTPVTPEPEPTPEPTEPASPTVLSELLATAETEPEPTPTTPVATTAPEPESILDQLLADV